MKVSFRGVHLRFAVPETDRQVAEAADIQHHTPERISLKSPVVRATRCRPGEVVDKLVKGPLYPGKQVLAGA